MGKNKRSKMFALSESLPTWHLPGTKVEKVTWRWGHCKADSDLESGVNSVWRTSWGRAPRRARCCLLRNAEPREAWTEECCTGWCSSNTWRSWKKVRRFPSGGTKETTTVTWTVQPCVRSRTKTDRCWGGGHWWYLKETYTLFNSILSMLIFCF